MKLPKTYLGDGMNMKHKKQLADRTGKKSPQLSLLLQLLWYSYLLQAHVMYLLLALEL